MYLLVSTCLSVLLPAPPVHQRLHLAMFLELRTRRQVLLPLKNCQSVKWGELRDVVPVLCREIDERERENKEKGREQKERERKRERERTERERRETREKEREGTKRKERCER